MQLASNAILNAIWDLWAKVEGKPLWKLVADFSPEQLVSVIDFRYITDELTPEQALAMLKDKEKTKQERMDLALKNKVGGFVTKKAPMLTLRPGGPWLQHQCRLAWSLGRSGRGGTEESGRCGLPSLQAQGWSGTRDRPEASGDGSQGCGRGCRLDGGREPDLGCRCKCLGQTLVAQLLIFVRKRSTTCQSSPT